MRSASAQPRSLAEGTPGAGLAGEVTIDLASEPATLDPALAYDVDAWSVVHSVYDALVQYGPDGRLEPLLAESLTLLDPLTYEIRLRQGVTFHNGEPLDARAVTFSVAHLVDPKVNSQVAENFKVIKRVEEVDALTVRLLLNQPAPWLPAQMAAWLVMLPPDYAADPAHDIGTQPVGTGPYRFVSWKRGAELALEVNPGYSKSSPKGRPMAERVSYRFVPEPSTRVSDLLAGTAGLIRSVPVDQRDAVASRGGEVIAEALSGSAWIRVPTDMAPFDDVRVRQALNYAVDIDGIVAALLGGNGKRLASFFVEGGMGYDATLAPYPYDPDRARALLQEAGHGDGFATRLEYTGGERKDVVEAIVGQLGEVGVRVEAQAVEIATFNGAWADPKAAPLRFATWRPLFDPYTLLSLVVSKAGFLSRYQSAEAQPLIDAGAAETDEAKRAETYRQLGRVLHDDPAAIYLYGLTALYGIASDTPPWTPRRDDYIIPTVRG